MRTATFARNEACQQSVTIKRFFEPFATSSMARNIFREIKLLRFLKHENLAKLLHISISPTGELYIATELMETNLQTLLDTRFIHGEFVQFFLYQIMRGLKYIHSAGIFHCDLKPSNILVDRNCDLKICNIVYAELKPWTANDVSTKYYKAPEAIIERHICDEYIDIWGAGCIFAELLHGKVLFPGQNSIHQLHVITKPLGTPSEIAINSMFSKNQGSDLVRSLPRSQGHLLSDIITNVDPEAIHLLEKLLVFDPQGRVSACEALAFAYLAPYHDLTDEPEAERKFDWKSGKDDDVVEVWKTKLHAEVLEHRERAELQQTIEKWLLEVRPGNPTILD